MTGLLVVYIVVSAMVSLLIYWANHQPCPFCDSDQNRVGPLSIALSGVLWPATIVAFVWFLLSDRGHP